MDKSKEVIQKGQTADISVTAELMKSTIVAEIVDSIQELEWYVKNGEEFALNFSWVPELEPISGYDWNLSKRSLRSFVLENQDAVDFLKGCLARIKEQDLTADQIRDLYGSEFYCSITNIGLYIDFEVWERYREETGRE